jgi:hypothetical protein
MAYYLYKEDRLSGPYSLFDIEQAKGVPEDTLVCEESAGYPNGNWRSIQDVFGGVATLPFEIDKSGAPSDINEDSWSGELSWVMPFFKTGRKAKIEFPLIDRYLLGEAHLFMAPPIHPISPPNLEEPISPALSAGLTTGTSLFEETILDQIQSLQKRFDQFDIFWKSIAPPAAPDLLIRPLPPSSLVIAESQKQIRYFAPPAAPAIPSAPVRTDDRELTESPVENPPDIGHDIFGIVTGIPALSESTAAVSFKDTGGLAELDSAQSVGGGLHLKMGDSFNMVSELEDTSDSSLSQEGNGLHLKMGDSFDALPEETEKSEIADEIPQTEEKSSMGIHGDLETLAFSVEPSVNEIQELASPENLETLPDLKSGIEPSHFFEHLSDPSVIEPPISEPVQLPPPAEVSTIPSVLEANSSPFGERVIQSSLPAAESNAGNVMEPLITPLFEAPSQRQSPHPESVMPDFSNAFSAPTNSSPHEEIGAIAPSQAVPESQNIVDRFAKASPDAPTQSQTKKAPSKWRSKFMPILGIGVILLVGIFFFLFFHNPKDLGTMLSAGADQRPLGLDVAPSLSKPEQVGIPVSPPISNGGGLPSAIAEQNQPQTTLPAGEGATVAPSANIPSTAQAVPAVSPSPQEVSAPPVKKPSRGDRAIEFVKEYPLEGDKGSVGKWLEYAFAADQGENARQEWTVGKLDQGSYLIRYRVIRGDASNNKKDIVYLFETDVKSGMVKGDNPLARALLSGEAPSVGNKTRKNKSARG